MDDPDTPPSPDRREALKARHRRAILDAARALMTEIGGTNFTVDQLAERADVSRRTVFNHFPTMDDIVLEVFGEMVETIVDSFDANLASQVTGQLGAASVFGQLAEALRAADLFTTMTEITRIFGDEGTAPTPRQAVLFERAIQGLGARLSQITLGHHPSADTFEVEVMCAALVSGALVAHRHWSEATGGVDTPESRRVWDELLGRLIALTRNGYGALT
ncbi:AcrR family transcriptional regulator [Lipingzhangella halophila]|uniref:AcrR family transcriptional regulator n=1 Tax=Lipingzhangella halophila TaxID=1783352 RepID=A0A7W7RHZ1_9ACTN|nr:TetR/AcrR family transcriptional regulator [Lipingzhangella halophila]MBB4932334.1 AcrR family transcriptional regulator [Lipingzhangella halophila]